MQKSGLRLYCFSPPVMLVTFLVEIIGAAYIVWRYKMTVLTRLITLILVCLAVFQGSEYMLCGGMGVPGGTWSKLGYSAITLLPPLGIHLALSIAGKKSRALTWAAYSSALVFVGYFAFTLNAISGHTCYANYAVFDTSKGFLSSMIYGIYYYGWLIAGVLICLWNAQITKKTHVKRALVALAIGYGAFIVPTTAFNLIDRSTIAGIPSIMCGFAVILAFVLLGKVAPESIERRIRFTTKVRLKLPF